MDKIYLSSLGGSGENGRNCYLIEMTDGYVLLDCGVKREIVDGQVGFYPDLTDEIVSGIKAVFLSHCHEDHVAGLPLLYQMGYRGKVYGSRETIKEALGFVKKWMGYVEKNHGALPFEPEMADRIEFAALEDAAWKSASCADCLTADTDNRINQGFRIPEIPDVQIMTGRSGHVLGGVWYIFTMKGKKILYTGDMCKDPATLAWDCPSECDAAIMNAAYAGKQIDQKEQYQKLLQAVKTCVVRSGKVMLPVPPKGRGIDIAMFLADNLPGAKLFVEDVVIKSMKELAGKHEWIKSGVLTHLPDNLSVITSEEERREALEYEGGAAYIAPDGMISTDLSLQYFEALKGDAANHFIISGHAAKGTAGAGVLDETWRKEHGVLASGEKVVFKVHMDDGDIQALCRKVGLKQVMLFHSDAPMTVRVKGLLKEDGVEAVTLLYPDKLEVRQKDSYDFCP